MAHLTSILAQSRCLVSCSICASQKIRPNFKVILLEAKTFLTFLLLFSPPPQSHPSLLGPPMRMDPQLSQHHSTPSCSLLTLTGSNPGMVYISIIT